MVDALPVQVYAAGSLREAFVEIARDHQACSGQAVALTFGASGLLRERIEKGAPAQVFACADMVHPQRLADCNGWLPPVVFTRNTLCALIGENLSAHFSEHLCATPDALLATLLRPDVRVGTSTPGADPSGDYAWAFFRRAEAVKPGACAQLIAKALQLTGADHLPKPPPGRGTYAWIMAQGQADVFLTYHSNAVAAQAEVPRLRVVSLPAPLQIYAHYGLSVHAAAPPAAHAFAKALRGSAAQAVLLRLGFGSD